MRVAKRVWYYTLTIMLALTLCTSALALMTQGERTVYASTEAIPVTIVGVTNQTVTQTGSSNRWMIYFRTDTVIEYGNNYQSVGAKVPATYQEPGGQVVALTDTTLLKGMVAGDFCILINYEGTGDYVGLPMNIADGTKVTFTFGQTFSFGGTDYQITNDTFTAYKKGSTLYTEQQLTYAESYRHAGLQHFYFLADTSTAPFSAATDTNITSSIKLSVNGQAAFGPAEAHALADKSQIRIALTTSGLNTQLANAIPGMTIEKAETAKVDIVVGQTYTVSEINYYIASADSYVAVDTSVDGVLKYEEINITEFVSAAKDAESRWHMHFKVDRDIPGEVAYNANGNYGFGFAAKVDGKLPSELNPPITGACVGVFKMEDRKFNLISSVAFLPSSPAEGTTLTIPKGAFATRVAGTVGTNLAYSFQNEMTLQYLSGEWKQVQTIIEKINNGTPEDRYVPVGTVFTAADIARVGYDITYAALNGVPMTPESEYTVTAFEDATIEVTYAPITYQAVFKADGETVDTLDYTVETTELEEPAVPQKDGYTAQWESYDITMDGMTINAVYTPIEYTLTINYVYADGTTAATTHTTQVDFGTAYSVDSPEIEGYTADKATVSGNMVVDGATITVTYTPTQYQAVFKAGGVTVETINYTIETDPETIVLPDVPVKAGYTGEWEEYEPALGGMIINAVYTPIKYTLTINYVYADGTTAAVKHTSQVDFGTAYSVNSPEVEGYTADKAKVTGNMVVDGVEITVTYTEKAEVPGCKGLISMQANIAIASAVLLIGLIGRKRKI